jgi:hypothetical protein
MLQLTPVEQRIEDAFNSNCAELKQAGYELLAAFIACFIAVFSLVRAIVHIVYAVLRFVLWGLALFLVFLYWCQAWAVARSHSLHTIREDNQHDR